MNKAVALLFGAIFISCVLAADWSPVDKVLEDSIKDGAFPGCVAIVGDKYGSLYARAFGDFTYGAVPPQNRYNPSMTLGTLFDLASCSKVTATTTAVAQFYQRGELPLHTKVSDILGADYAQKGKGDVQVLNCLLHNAGYPPDPVPNYWDPKFGCPETAKLHPEENFSCQQKIYEALLAQDLINPIGAVYIYSDLSFITLQYVVGTLAKQLNYIAHHDLLPGCDQGGSGAVQCYFEAYVRKYVFSPYEMLATGYLPAPLFWSDAAPCENDTTYLNRVIQGQVSDGNAYALGGIAGHAGVFSTAIDLLTFMKTLMFPPEPNFFPQFILNKTTMDLFTKEYNHSQSSRALGWNTNDPTVNDEGWNCSCGDLSPKTWMHVGYTGTELCGDPDRELITVFLTNRVYPTDLNIKIRTVRQEFNTAVRKVFDGQVLNDRKRGIFSKELRAADARSMTSFTSN